MRVPDWPSRSYPSLSVRHLFPCTACPERNRLGIAARDKLYIYGTGEKIVQTGIPTVGWRCPNRNLSGWICVYFGALPCTICVILSLYSVLFRVSDVCVCVVDFDMPVECEHKILSAGRGETGRSNYWLACIVAREVVQYAVGKPFCECCFRVCCRVVVTELRTSIMYCCRVCNL